MRVLIFIALVFLAAPLARHAIQDSELRATYWPNGALQSEIQARRNLNGRLVRHGTATFYDESGSIVGQGQFENDRQQGTWVWLDAEGRREAECEYVEGRGVYRTFYPSGALMQEGPVVGDRREGLWQEFYPSGRVRLRGGYRDDVQHGVWTAFTDEEAPRQQSVEFVDGVRQER